MTYQIDISSVAKKEADDAFLSYAQYATPKQAQDWYQGLFKAIGTLKSMPRRCSIARENPFFSQEIRQLLYGKGKHTYRILFTVLDQNPSPTVRILHIRNAAQQTIGAASDEA